MRIASTLFLLALLTGTALADDDGEIERGTDKGTFGIGLIAGEPTGICAKLYLKNDQALQAAFGGALFGGGIQGSVDYVFHPYILQSRDSFVLATYLGPGVRVIRYSTSTRDDTAYFALGLRAVGGLMFDFKNVPLDAFIEVAGVFEYGFADGEGAGIAFNAGVGIRYYF